jgi:hypothetical protein
MAPTWHRASSSPIMKRVRAGGQPPLPRGAPRVLFRGIAGRGGCEARFFGGLGLGRLHRNPGPRKAGGSQGSAEDVCPQSAQFSPRLAAQVSRSCSQAESSMQYTHMTALSRMGLPEARRRSAAARAGAGRHAVERSRGPEHLLHRHRDLGSPPARVQTLQSHPDEARRADHPALVLVSEHPAHRPANEVFGRVGARHEIGTPRHGIVCVAHAAHVDLATCRIAPGALKISSITCAISRVV